MLDYYSAINTLLWVSLIVLCVLVYENDRFKRSVKVRYYITYGTIILAAVFEWIGIKLNGNTDLPSVFLRVVKCGDYILTPLAGTGLIRQLNIKNIWNKVIRVIMIFNVALQIISLFTPWMIVIDENNVYSHGSLYWMYVGVYLAIIVTVIIQFVIYGKRFRNQNRFSLYLIMVLVLLGIFMQELFGGEVRTAYIGITIGALMMYIHSTEYSQQVADDNIHEQQIKINTDALTGLLSRHAYSQALERYMMKMPQDMVAFSIDINGLKTVNDTLGHEAGDELICGAASCIREVFDKAECYRTGGDEFIVLVCMNKDQVLASIARIDEVSGNWHGKIVDSLSLSIGYALRSDYKEETCEQLVRESDKQMYKAKDKYYKSIGLSRRIT